MDLVGDPTIAMNTCRLYEHYECILAIAQASDSQETFGTLQNVSPHPVLLQVLSLMATRCCNQLCSLSKLWKLAVVRSWSMWRIQRDTKRKYVIPDRQGIFLYRLLAVCVASNL